MTTLSQQRRVVALTLELMNKLAIEPRVSKEVIDRLRLDLQHACVSAGITYGEAVQAAVISMEHAGNRTLINKLFRLARCGARGDVLTVKSYEDGHPMLKINPLKVTTCAD
jgi:hypothetical protein